MNASHPGELNLRRLRAGELTGAAHSELSAHLGSCNDCRNRMSSLELEQAEFERSIPFVRFERGVVGRMEAQQSRRWSMPNWSPSVATAAALLVVVAVTLRPAPTGPNNLKGGAEVSLRISGPGPDAAQRVAAANAAEALGPGERVRIGVNPGSYRFLASVSVDDAGEVTPLYPERGQSLPVLGEREQFLPGSLEFTGRGTERVIVVLSEEPLSIEVIKSAARLAYDEAGGDLSHLPPLKVNGEQFHHTLLKP